MKKFKQILPSPVQILPERPEVPVIVKDFDALAKSACYVDWCGCPGMIWPQSGDSVDLLTTDEKLQGMEVLAKTTRNLSTTALCLGV